MLALTLAEKAATAAPAGLASTITSASLANVAAGGVMWTAALTKLQLSAAGAILIASVAAPWLVQHQADRELREKDALFQREAARLARLQAENLRLAGLFAQANASRATNSSPGELLKLRGEVARLRRGLQEHSPAKPASAAPTNDLLASMAQEWTERGRQLRQWVEEHPAEKIPELQFLTDRDWVDAVYPSRLETEEEYHRALSTLRSNGELRFLDRLWPALDHYLKDHGGRFPADMTQLAAYLNPPVETAILDRYEIVPSRVLVEELQHAGEWVVTEKAAVNETWDVRWAFGVSNGCMADSRVTNRWTTRR
jgi:hypothetical protein